MLLAVHNMRDVYMSVPTRWLECAQCVQLTMVKLTVEASIEFDFFEAVFALSTIERRAHNVMLYNVKFQTRDSQLTARKVVKCLRLCHSPLKSLRRSRPLLSYCGTVVPTEQVCQSSWRVGDNLSFTRKHCVSY